MQLFRSGQRLARLRGPATAPRPGSRALPAFCSARPTPSLCTLVRANARAGLTRAAWVKSPGTAERCPWQRNAARSSGASERAASTRPLACQLVSGDNCSWEHGWRCSPRAQRARPHRSASFSRRGTTSSTHATLPARAQRSNCRWCSPQPLSSGLPPACIAWLRAQGAAPHVPGAAARAVAAAASQAFLLLLASLAGVCVVASAAARRAAGLRTTQLATSCLLPWPAPPDARTAAAC